ncbi:MAG: DUF362 domain-containing protein [Desulfobacterales bacterium]|nr:DUF362 domain-containing protein [Desulfobacterales bacterium]
MSDDESRITFEFDETMTGFVVPGSKDPEAGFEEGKEKGYECAIGATIVITDMREFTTITGHDAKLVGTVSVPGIGEKLDIQNGVFSLFEIEKDPAIGKTQKTMVYEFNFNSDGGDAYYLYGVKKLYGQEKKFEPIQQMTTLYTKIYKGDKVDEDRIHAAGVLHFHMRDIFSLTGSMRVEGTDNLKKKAEISAQFLDFCYEEILEIYLNNVGLLYKTDYQNLVVSGACNVNGDQRHLFFYGGAHDQGFPWGDPQTFWDVSLILSGPEGENPERYIIAKTILENMKIDIRDDAVGVFSYKGKLYRLTEGYQASFSDDLTDPGKSPILQEVDAEIKIEFNAEVPLENHEEVPAVIVPFAIPEGLENPFLLFLKKELDKFASSSHELGIRLGIRPVSIQTAEIKVGGEEVALDIAEAWGEAERSTFNFVREPTLAYNYFCGIDPRKKKINVHVEGGVLFDDTTHYAKDIFDRFFSAMAQPFSKMEVRLEGNEIEQIDRAPKPIKFENEYMLEVNYDHFDTAVFQRRVVLLKNASNRAVWALEEDMKRINLRRIPPAVEKEKIASPMDKPETLVAVYNSRRSWPPKEEDPVMDRPGVWDNLKSLFDWNRREVPGQISEKRRVEMEKHDKRNLLQRVIQKTRFTTALQKRARELNKPPSDLKIVIKPNFMFLYNKNDHTTYTDPALVKSLIDHIHREGFTNISVVEAHSTYGEYFRNRGVVDVANYIGLDGGGGKYKVVDMTLDEQIDPNPSFKGPLKGQKASKTWADADFRISFAKNKTHSYAYYTLTLKCIYGALPLANKFKEYHCDRGIYGTTLEYLARYPIHFGFIDAYVSADGPFGIFADKTPNYTRTIIGGENIVGVDWIGASKMGYNPMVSEYMKKAVEQFGKPRIKLQGNLGNEIYFPWVNVPVELSFGLNDVLDKHHKFGNFMYSALANMDEEAFPRKSDPWWMKCLRVADKPIRDMFFVHSPHKLLKHMYDMGELDEPGENAFKDVTLDK